MTHRCPKSSAHGQQPAHVHLGSDQPRELQACGWVGVLRRLEAVNSSYSMSCNQYFRVLARWKQMFVVSPLTSDIPLPTMAIPAKCAHHLHHPDTSSYEPSSTMWAPAYCTLERGVGSSFLLTVWQLINQEESKESDFLMTILCSTPSYCAAPPNHLSKV